MTRPLPIESASERGIDPLGLDGASDEWLRRARAAATGETLGQLGPYAVLDACTPGGQGAVYRCRGSDGVIVAVKRLHARTGRGSGESHREPRELLVAANPPHPVIVRVSPVRIDGELVLEMPWIDGLHFVEWAWPEPGVRRPIDEVLATITEVCDAVACAHERGIAHGDLKPSNILVDGDGRPHLLDFGLARSAGAATGALADPTVTGQLACTPAYAAPEQLAGRTERVGARSDVYSIGVLLYEALTGRHPCGEGTSLARLLRNIEEIEPMRPRALDRSIPRGVEAVVLKSLQKDPARRYASAALLADDLRRCRAHEPPHAALPGLAFDLRVFRQHHPVTFWGTGAAALIIAAATISIAIHLVQLQRAHRETNAAHEAAERVIGLLVGSLAAEREARSSGGAAPPSDLDHSTRWMEQELRDSPWALARARVALGQIYAREGAWESAADQLGSAIAQYRRLGPADRQPLVEALRIMGVARAHMRDPGAVAIQREALAMAERLFPAGSPGLAGAYMALGETILLVNGQDGVAQAEPHFRKAIKLFEGDGPCIPIARAMVLTTWGSALADHGAYEAAVPVLLEACGLFEEGGWGLGSNTDYRECVALAALALERADRAEEAGALRARLTEPSAAPGREIPSRTP